MNVDNTQEFRCLSLCSGYGGLELGLERAINNFRTVTYVEVEAFACANLVSKMEKGFLDAVPIWTDIKTFNGQPFRGKIHIITAGYPCQPFSVAGKRKGTDDPRHLWPHIAGVIEAVRPVWFFGENVSGHLALGFPEVYRSLRDMGYTVEAGLFTAAECGGAFEGLRLFILAKTHSDGKLLKFRKSGMEGKSPICRWCKTEHRPCSVLPTSWSPRPCQIHGISGKDYGTRFRVDRLRLLGNGVVPQQAEKAFRHLMALFGKE